MLSQSVTKPVTVAVADAVTVAVAEPATVAAMTASEHTSTAMSSTVCELLAAALDCKSPVFAPVCEPPAVTSTELSTTGDGCAVGLADVMTKLFTQTPGATPSSRCWPLLHEMQDDAESNRHVAQEL
jgi:hypothetical protein